MSNYVLVADDDLDDQLLLKEAFKKNKSDINLKFVNDGEELLEYLEKNDGENPAFILLDLNMPRKGGKECLKFLKLNKLMKNIPIVIFSTSSLDEDVHESYSLGANSYIHKPTTFQELQALTSRLNDYWLSTVKLPAV